MIHFDDGGMVDEPVYGGDGNRGIRKHLIPFAERLIAGDDEAFPFVALGNEFEQDGGFGLIFADIAEIVEDEAVELVELGQDSGQVEVPARGLQLLDEIGGPGKQDAVAVIDEAGANGSGNMGLAGTARPEDQNVGAGFDPCVAGSQGGDMRFADAGCRREVEGL